MTGTDLDEALAGISQEIYSRVSRVLEISQRGRRSLRQASEVASKEAGDGGRVEERRWECVKFRGDRACNKQGQVPPIIGTGVGGRNKFRKWSQVLQDKIEGDGVCSVSMCSSTRAIPREMGCLRRSERSELFWMSGSVRDNHVPKKMLTLQASAALSTTKCVASRCRLMWADTGMRR